MTAFLFNDGPAEGFQKKITANTATDIIDATAGIRNVARFEVNENAGTVQNLTVELYDVANALSYCLGAGGVTWKARAVTAGQSIAFEAGYQVPLGWKLRVTSSDAAGKFDVVGIVTGKVRSPVNTWGGPGR